jgi:acetate kinase
MDPSKIVILNAGSSSIKFAIVSRFEPLAQRRSGAIGRIGLGESSIVVPRADDQEIERIPINATDFQQAGERLAEWFQKQRIQNEIVAIGHRIVHGGLRLLEHQVVTEELIAELRCAEPLDPVHLPQEIDLLEAFRRHYPGVPHIACFDTAFCRDLPRVAQMLPIPREFDRKGIRRFGFHGLSYTYLMSTLQSVAPQEAGGRVILAHLGSGASMTAVLGGRPVDTSMAFTPTAGLVMGTRPGDIDPGLLVYLMQTEKMSFEQTDAFINHRCGLKGVSETSPDMRDLFNRRESDSRAAEAIALFCYQVKKFVGAYAAALGGLDTLVFSGGIGERSAEVRAEICEGLKFLGVQLDAQRNVASDALISADGAPVKVRVIPTDEEIVIANIVRRLMSDEAKH